MEKRDIPTSHIFKETELTSVEPEVKNAIKRGISMVWDKLHGGGQSSFNIVYADSIYNPENGQITDRSAEYDPDTDTFKIATGTMRQRFKSGLSDSDNALIIAAHEATHRVQFFRGENPIPSAKQTATEYIDDRHETEGWEEALDAFKGVYPNASGELKIGHKIYSIPKKSKY